MSHRQKILVVGDEYDTVFVLKNGLERKGGYNVDVFTDRFTALNDFQADSYDLILIDIRMPNMTGFDRYKKIKERDNKVKISFLSASQYTYEEFKKYDPMIGEPFY